MMKTTKYGPKLNAQKTAGPKHSDALVEQARVLHDNGFGYRNIARQLGLPRDTVRHWCTYRRR